MKSTVLGVLTTLLVLLGASLAIPSAPATAAAPRVVSRTVEFSVENTNSTSALCLPDQETYRLRARLIGPRRSVQGLAGATRFNVLVHGEGTGGWFWNLRGYPAYDYATRLAERGETSLVIDRLGYAGSRLPRGGATCLGAQAEILHQVVQQLRSGNYEFADGRGATPAAAHVVTQGHGLGAAIAQVEAGTFDDVDGLVLMSWTDRGATALAGRVLAAQGAACLTGGDHGYAPVTADQATFRRLLFAAAPAAIQRRATALRGGVPCGDVVSAATMLLASNLAAGQVDAPVLLLYGTEDAANRASARAHQAAAYPTKVTTRTFAGAGSALPLERPAAVRAAVLRWLR